MNEKQQAVESFKKLAKQLKTMLVVADELEKIGSIEQAAGEAQNRLDQLRNEVELGAAQVESAKTEALAAKAKAAVILEAAAKDAAETKALAESSAAVVVADAEKAAAALIADAKAMADSIAADTDAARAVLAEINKEIKEQNEKLLDVKSQLAKITASLHH